jgi:hypothetical protein
MQNFNWKTSRQHNTWKDDTKKKLRKIGCELVQMDQDKLQREAILNTVINIMLYEVQGIS